METKIAGYSLKSSKFLDLSIEWQAPCYLFGDFLLFFSENSKKKVQRAGYYHYLLF